MDKQTDRQTDGQTYGQTDFIAHFSANKLSQSERETDGRTDNQTDGQTMANSPQKCLQCGTFFSFDGTNSNVSKCKNRSFLLKLCINLPSKIRHRYFLDIYT